MNKNPIDMLLDENNSEPIVLYNEKNEPIRFDQIAVVPLKGETYAILKPLDMSDILAEASPGKPRAPRQKGPRSRPPTR